MKSKKQYVSPNVRTLRMEPTTVMAGSGDSAIRNNGIYVDPEPMQGDARKSAAPKYDIWSDGLDE